MTVTVEQLQNYVGTQETGSFINGCLSSGKLRVANYIGGAAVPESIVDTCVLHVASELFHRRSAPSGIMQFATLEGSPARLARDPMAGVYEILLPFVGYAV